MRRTMFTLGGIGIACLVTSSLFARPLYKSCYEEAFADHPAVRGKKMTCALCHDGDNKKNLNKYGQRLAEELDEKNCRDRDKIIEALLKIGPGLGKPDKPEAPPGPKPPLPDPPPPVKRSC